MDNSTDHLAAVRVPDDEVDLYNVSEGGWYAVLQIPRTRTEEEWTLKLLADSDVLVQPGFFYDFESEAFLVLSLLTEPSTFAEGVTRLLSSI